MEERHAIPPKGSGHQRHTDKPHQRHSYIRARLHWQRIIGQAKSQQESARGGQSEIFFFGTVKPRKMRQENIGGPG